jgi:primosomal replication protein N
VSSIWNPDGRQVAGAVEEREPLRVSPIGLDPLAGFTWDHRGCRHGALMSERCKLAMDAVVKPPSGL